VSVGATVAEGEPMVEIYSPELIVAQSELLHTLRTVRDLDASSLRILQDTTRQTLDAGRDRLRLLGLTDVQIDRLIAVSHAHTVKVDDTRIHYRVEASFTESGQPFLF
jgi:Cu(I)/Ag(I) efflux system membrane fusion protein